MLEYISNYFKKNKYYITICESGIYFYNYKKIDSIQNNKIIIKTDDERIVVEGSNLVITKLLSSELLVKGKIINLRIDDNE